jgi:hypothetical protein
MASQKEQSRLSSPGTFENRFLNSAFSASSEKSQTISEPLHSIWKPTAFRTGPLLVATLVSWALIAILQLLLVKSQEDGGIIFAANIEKLPFEMSFLYLYLPTVIALVLSIFWSWIDLQIKRLEPYYQLSKPGGAWGKDSLLLSYPFDFLPFVPFVSFKNRLVLTSLLRKSSLSTLCTDLGLDIGLSFGPVLVSFSLHGASFHSKPVSLLSKPSSFPHQRPSYAQPALFQHLNSLTSSVLAIYILRMESFGSTRLFHHT